MRFGSELKFKIPMYGIITLDLARQWTNAWEYSQDIEIPFVKDDEYSTLSVSYTVKALDDGTFAVVDGMNGDMTIAKSLEDYDECYCAIFDDLEYKIYNHARTY